MKPLIGITVGEIANAMYPWGPIVYGQSYTYCAAIERAGGVPVLIPIMADSKNLKQLYGQLEGILFAGGNDLNPELYDEIAYPTTVDYSDRRDETEVRLMQWALKDKKPILGICRGMQLLNVVRGGTLHQHVLTDVDGADDHTASILRQDPAHQAHKIKINADSRLSRIVQTQSLRTNSLHHQAVKTIGDNLQAVAWAEDGVIEAIESVDDTYILGMQCHPEAMETTVVPEFRRLFRSFVDAARIAAPDSDDVLVKI